MCHYQDQQTTVYLTYTVTINKQLIIHKARNNGVENSDINFKIQFAINKA